MLNTNTAPQKIELVWSPQSGPQEALINCPVELVLFGGARGGGKTDAALGKVAIQCERYGKGFKAIFFRKALPQLDAVIARSHEIFGPIGWEYKEVSKTWTSPAGATCKFRHLEKDADAGLYQGHDYQLIVFEEAGEWNGMAAIRKMMGTMRSGRGHPVQMILTANPGGLNHSHLKKLFIDPAPGGWKVIKTLDKFSGRSTERVYIPSRVTDNKILTDNDPNYVARLSLTGSEQLVKAWLLGDWNIIEGAFFTEFDTNKHILRPWMPPAHWMRFRCGDWGSAKPYSFYWLAVASEQVTSPCGKIIPKNAIVVYRELYGVKVDPETGEYEPNQGTREYAETVGRRIAASEEKDPGKFSYGVLDPSAFSTNGGPSIAERIYQGSGKKIMFRRADNKRVAGKGAMGGWDQVRSRLAGAGAGEEHQLPMLYFTESCIHLIRTLPTIPHDRDNAEDIDTDSEDHAVDALRYGVMSRPFASRPLPQAAKQTSLSDKTLNELFDEEEEMRAQSAHGGRI